MPATMWFTQQQAGWWATEAWAIEAETVLNLCAANNKTSGTLKRVTVTLWIHSFISLETCLTSVFFPSQGIEIASTGYSNHYVTGAAAEVRPTPPPLPPLALIHKAQPPQWQIISHGCSHQLSLQGFLRQHCCTLAHKKKEHFVLLQKVDWPIRLMPSSNGILWHH